MKRRSNRSIPPGGSGYVPAGPPTEMISEEQKVEEARAAGRTYVPLDLNDNSPDLIRLWKEMVARYRKADGPK